MENIKETVAQDAGSGGAVSILLNLLARSSPSPSEKQQGATPLRLGEKQPAGRVGELKGREAMGMRMGSQLAVDKPILVLS
jgi:hypothetical protein